MTRAAVRTRVKHTTTDGLTVTKMRMKPVVRLMMRLMLVVAVVVFFWKTMTPREEMRPMGRRTRGPSHRADRAPDHARGP